METTVCFMFLISVVAGVVPTIRLENNCDKTIVFPCPYGNKNRNASIGFYHLPKTECLVGLTVESGCLVNSAIYLNVWKSVLPLTSSVNMYEEDYDTSKLKLVKVINGGKKEPIAIQDSFAQLITEYSLKPKIYIQLKTLGFSDDSYETFYELTIMRYTKGTSGDQTYCPALKGYAPTWLICYADYRITCPGDYDSYVYVPNPATTVKSCRLSFTDLLSLLGSS